MATIYHFNHYTQIYIICTIIVTHPSYKYVALRKHSVIGRRIGAHLDGNMSPPSDRPNQMQLESATVLVMPFHNNFVTMYIIYDIYAKYNTIVGMTTILELVYRLIIPTAQCWTTGTTTHTSSSTNFALYMYILSHATTFTKFSRF